MNPVVDFFYIEMRKFKVPYTLCEQLAKFGHAPYLAWTTRRLADRKDRSGSILAMSMLMDETVPLARIRYALYSFETQPIEKLKKMPNYDAVMGVIKKEYKFPEFWDDIVQYNYAHCVQLAIIILLDQGMSMKDIMFKLKVRHTFAYKVRSAYLKEKLNELSKP